MSHCIRRVLLLFMLCLFAGIPALSQQVSLTLHRVTVKQAMRHFTQKTGFSFVYFSTDIDVHRRIDVTIKQASIHDAVSEILKGQDVSFQIQEKSIIIQRIEKPQLQKQLPTIKTITATGYVVDSEGRPIIGATVYQRGSKTGTVTDINGHFKLDIPAGSTLEISYIGYKPRKAKAAEDLRLKMEENPSSLNEIIIIGYGSLTRKETSSAISHVNADQLAHVSSIDAGALLLGKVSGLSVVNTGIGDPNEQTSLQLRGISSRSAGLRPLIVVDGVPDANLTNVNAADIESIDVLKDGAASAIYGTRASNGVIIVNLKKGSQDGMAHARYEFNYAMNVPKREIDLLTPAEYRQYRAVNNPFLDKGASTDWFKAATQTGTTQIHTLSFTGGNKNTNYRVTADYRYATGIDLRSSRREYGARMNVSHTPTGKMFTFTAHISPRYIHRNNADWSWFSSLLSNNPTMPVKDSSGRYTDFFGSSGSNVIEDMKTVKDGSEIKLLNWDGIARANLSSLLFPASDNIMLNAQLTYAESRIDKFYYFYSPSTYTGNLHDGYKGQASRSYHNLTEHNLDFVVNLNWQLKLNHHIKAMMGYSYTYGMRQGLAGENKNFNSDILTWNNLGAGEWSGAERGRTDVSSYKNDHKLIGFFGRLNYCYANRYIASLSLRHEGSSRFGKNHKWGGFPAFSLGWRLSKEKAFENIKWITDLKLRYDFGITGNQDFDNYLSLSTYRSFGEAPYEDKLYRVWGPNRNPNPDLRWEKGYNQNIGIDFSLFHDRVNGSVNYYHRRQTDLLGNYSVSVPPNLFNETYTNVGTLKNRGWEVELAVIPLYTPNLKWTIEGNAYTNYNEFSSFSNNTYTGQTFYGSCMMDNPGNPGYLQRIEVGKRIGNFFTFRYAGISKDGNWLIYDKNNLIIPIDKGTDDDKAVTGNGLPKFNMALNNRITWRNMDISVAMRGVFGFDIFDVHDFYYGLQSGLGNVTSNAFRRNAYITKGSNVISDYFIHRGDYWKIESLTIGYTVHFAKKYLENLRVYASANNLYTFTHFPGIDPSLYQVNGLTPGTLGGRSAYYPSVFQFVWGLQVIF